MKDENNKNEEVNIFFDYIENFVNLIDDSFIEMAIKNFLIKNNMHESDKKMIEILIENEKQLNFRLIKTEFLVTLLVDLTYTTDNVEDKVILKIISAAFINYVRPILAKKCKIYEKKSMIHLERNMLKKFNKKIKNTIMKDTEVNNYNDDNFIKNVYLDSFDNINIIHEQYRKTITSMIILVSKLLIFIFFYPLLYKLKHCLLRNSFNIGLVSLYTVYIANLYTDIKSKKNIDTQENELKNTISSFFQNLNIIVESDNLDKELNNILKYIKNILDSDDILHKYQDIKFTNIYLEKIGKYKIIETGVSILINDGPILFFLEILQSHVINYTDNQQNFMKKLCIMHNFIDILNVEHYQVSKTIAWNNNHDMYPNLFVLEHVTLEYEGKDEIKNKVLENVSLNFELGKSYFIYGKSGCGKTTLLNALMKRFPTSSGTIKFLGIYEKYTYFSIRKYLNYITSESALFYKNLYYNITYGINEKFLMENKKKIMEQITKYMTLFGLDKLIPTMKTTNATKLSKGQTQRVSIIRMFIDIIFKDIKILFLDEFTSNIDNKTEEIIFTELRKLQQKYHFTLIYVSHNLYNKKYSDYSYEIDVENKNIIKKETQKTVL